jgi:hypothetical protein
LAVATFLLASGLSFDRRLKRNLMLSLRGLRAFQNSLSVHSTALLLTLLKVKVYFNNKKYFIRVTLILDLILSMNADERLGDRDIA